MPIPSSIDPPFGLLPAARFGTNMAMPEGAVLLREPDEAARIAAVSLDGAVTDRPGKGSGGHFS